MENEEEKTTTETEGQTTPSTSSYTDPSLDNTKQQLGGLDYINKATQTGQEGAEALEKNVNVPKYTPITYKMLKGDPEVRRGIPSLIRNAVFKGLEGALSTKASGRDFDPTTRMGQYDDAEMQRYTENATDLENTIYQAQKQPIENAISAKAQAGIQTEDAALNSYIQDYTAEKDQNRKFALLQQLMGQAGLYQKDENGNVLTGEDGNPLLKDWTDLQTSDLLKLNQLMQYLSGDTSVMNLLVGQYGPDIMDKIDAEMNKIQQAGGIVPYLMKLASGGNAGGDGEETTNPKAITSQYTVQEVLDGLQSEDPDTRAEMTLYKNARLVELPDGNWYDVSDLSNGNYLAIAKALVDAEAAKKNTVKTKINEIEGKLKKLDSTFSNKQTSELMNNLKVYMEEARGSATTPPLTNGGAGDGGVSDIGGILDDMKKLEGAKNGSTLPVDVDDLLDRIDKSNLDEEVKKEYKDAVNENKRSIELNAQEKKAIKRIEITEKDAEDRAKNLKNGALKSVKGLTNTNYEKAKLKKNQKESDLYTEALAEAKALYDALQGTGEPIQVLKKTDIWKRLKNICLTSQGDGRFAELDKSFAEKNPDVDSLGSYLADMGDFEKWGK